MTKCPHFCTRVASPPIRICCCIASSAIWRSLSILGGQSTLVHRTHTSPASPTILCCCIASEAICSALSTKDGAASHPDRAFMAARTRANRWEAMQGVGKAASLVLSRGGTGGDTG